MKFLKIETESNNIEYINIEHITRVIQENDQIYIELINSSKIKVINTYITYIIEKIYSK